MVWYLVATKYKKKGENGLETLGFNSPSHNPENCRLNGDRKLLTQKIMRVDVVTRLWSRLFSARSAIFCRYWTCSFSCRNNQAIGGRGCLHFLFLLYPIFVYKMVMVALRPCSSLFLTVQKYSKKGNLLLPKLPTNFQILPKRVIFDDIRREICPTSSSHIAKNGRCFRSSSCRKSRSASCSCR